KSLVQNDQSGKSSSSCTRSTGSGRRHRATGEGGSGPFPLERVLEFAQKIGDLLAPYLEPELLPRSFAAVLRGVYASSRRRRAWAFVERRSVELGQAVWRFV